MNAKHSEFKVRFPLWQYLNQPLFSSTSKTVLNPFLFWYLYRIQLLEQCWIQDYIQLLERCWTQDFKSKRGFKKDNFNEQEPVDY
jgi:hypothetical protein